MVYHAVSDTLADCNFCASNLHHRKTQCREASADIFSYIEFSIQQKLNDGELLVGDQGMGITIKEALINGAKGMFVYPLRLVIAIFDQQSPDLIQVSLGLLSGRSDMFANNRCGHFTRPQHTSKGFAIYLRAFALEDQG